MSAPRVFTRENGVGYLDSAVDPALWTALIPAAGRGTRLGFDHPKILFPIAGRPILEWLVDLLKPLCGQFVFVLSPQGVSPVEQALSPLLPSRFVPALQQKPLGMADAIRCGLARVETTHTLIVWGDQVAVKPESLEFLMRLHQGTAYPSATCPTLWRDHPYIHFERTESGRVSRILQAREGDQMPVRGESDSGVFLFRTEALRQSLPRLLDSHECIGAKTREQNFLPIFPLLDPEQLITAPIMTESESVGVNSPQDAAYLEKLLPTPDSRTEPRPQGSVTTK